MPNPWPLVQVFAPVRASWRGLPVVGMVAIADLRRLMVCRRATHSWRSRRAWSGGGPLGSGQQGEGVGVAGTHGVEVTAIEGGDLGDAGAFGDGDDGGVGGAEGEVGVGLDESGHAFVVSEFEVDDRDGLRDDGAEERRFDLGSAGAGQE
jgi:hypothetical protein